MSRRLYALLVEEHQLPAELILLKSLFLLGSGELYRAVLDALEPVLASRPALLVALLAATAAAAAPSAATSAASASSRETPSQSQAQTAALALHTELEQCFRFAINYVGPSAFGSSLPGTIVLLTPLFLLLLHFAFVHWLNERNTDMLYFAGCKTQSEDELYDMLVSKFNFVYTNPTITPLFTIESGSGNNSSLDPSLAPLFNLFAGLTIRYRIRYPFHVLIKQPILDRSALIFLNYKIVLDHYKYSVHLYSIAIFELVIVILRTRTSTYLYANKRTHHTHCFKRLLYTFFIK